MIRLVAFDLDGTVLNEVGQASEASLEAVRALVARGVAVASISGRNVEKSQVPFAGIPETARAMYVGSYNGAIVLGPAAGDGRALLHEERLPEETFRALTAFIGEGGFNFVYCRCETGPDGVREAYMADRETASVRKLGSMTGMRFVFDAGLLERMHSGELGPPPKLILLPGDGTRDAALAEMRAAFGERLYLARTGTDRIEAMHPGVNKGVALHAIRKACGLPTEAVLAVGDGDNDLPMLKEAGVAVLMGNADEETARHAGGMGVERTGGVEAEGFAEAVGRYVLGGE